MSGKSGPAAWGNVARRVLIVDDEKDFVLSLVDILESRGYRVETAHSVSEARDKIRNFDAQVALLDIRVGRDNGIDAICVLGKVRPEILCVMMTAYADADTAIQAIQEGAYDYLRKPLEARDLLATLDRCFEKAHLRTEKACAEEALRLRNEELADVNARLQMMVESATSIATCRSREELARIVIKEFARNMTAEGGSIFICHEDRLELVHAIESAHVPSAILLPLAETTVLGRVLRDKQPLLVREVADDPDITGSEWGGYTDGSLLAFPLTDEEGEVICLLALHNKKRPPFTSQDLELGTILVSLSSEVLRALLATEALHSSEERYRNLVDNATDIIFEADLNGHFTFANPVATRVLGYSVDEILEMHYFDLVAPDLREKLRLKLRQQLEQRTPTVFYEIPVARKDGEIVWLAHNIQTIVTDGRATGVHAVARDVTERRRAQEEAETSRQQLIESDRLASLGTLVAGVAHEINNPNSFIMLNAPILSSIFKDVLSILEEHQLQGEDIRIGQMSFATAMERVPLLLEGIREGANRIKDIVSSLKDFARQDKPDALERVDMNRAVRNAVTLTYNRVKKSTHNFSLHEAPLLPHFQGNRQRIEQVLVNLINNACDALPDLKQALSVSTYFDEKSQCVMVAVKDEGIGINEDDLRRIADPFFTTKRDSGGTGLGLSISDGIIRDHGGTMTFNSTVGEGTIVTIALPLGGSEENSVKVQGGAMA